MPEPNVPGRGPFMAAGRAAGPGFQGSLFAVGCGSPSRTPAALLPHLASQCLYLTQPQGLPCCVFHPLRPRSGLAFLKTDGGNPLREAAQLAARLPASPRAFNAAAAAPLAERPGQGLSAEEQEAANKTG